MRVDDEWSLGAKSLHGVEVGGAPGGDQAGQGCDGKQQGRYGCEDDGVEGLSLVEHGADEANGECTCSETDDEAEKSGPDAVEEDGAEELFAASAEGDADAEF